MDKNLKNGACHVGQNVELCIPGEAVALHPAIACRHCIGFHVQALWISRADTLDFTCRHFGFHVQALCLYADVDSHLSISCLIVENSLVEHSAFDLDSAKQSMAKQSGACFKHRL